VGPELDEDDAAPQPLHGQGPAVDPGLTGDVRSLVAELQRLAGGGRATHADESDEQDVNEASAPAHGYGSFSIIIVSSFIVSHRIAPGDRLAGNASSMGRRGALSQRCELFVNPRCGGAVRRSRRRGK
jgi:hypothetical protein